MEEKARADQERAQLAFLDRGIPQIDHLLEVAARAGQRNVVRVLEAARAEAVLCQARLLSDGVRRPE